MFLQYMVCSYKKMCMKLYIFDLWSYRKAVYIKKIFLPLFVTVLLPLFLATSQININMNFFFCWGCRTKKKVYSKKQTIYAKCFFYKRKLGCSYNFIDLMLELFYFIFFIFKQSLKNIQFKEASLFLIFSNSMIIVQKGFKLSRTAPKI